ncbi:MAG TPA: glycoside hydrolase domain-containing protein, partial [Mucilaginibacter sp.]|nr:glycoside hydrolase domain-containing protein [Mucilaginibacter sp.]
YASAYGYSGFLRWAYDAWPQDPNRDARHGGWAAGDCYLVYPGANSGIRFEKLREGISDYEKIRIIKEKAAVSADKKCRELLTKLNDHMNTLANETKFSEDTLKMQVSEGQELIRELSNRLTAKK